MITVEEILSDLESINLKEKWYSEDEIRKIIDKIDNYARKSEDIPGCIRYSCDLKKELFGDEE